jgi:hypothetical protein
MKFTEKNIKQSYEEKMPVPQLKLQTNLNLTRKAGKQARKIVKPRSENNWER